MANITYRITLLDEGLDTGPNYEVFTSVNCVDYTFVQNINLEDIQDFADVTVDDSVNCIRLFNNNALCTNFRTIVVGTAPSTTTTTLAPTTTTTSTTTSTTTTTTTTLSPFETCIEYGVGTTGGTRFFSYTECGTGRNVNTFVSPSIGRVVCSSTRPSGGSGIRVTVIGTCTAPFPTTTTTTTAGPTTTTTAGPTTTSTTTECPIDIGTCMRISVFNPETVNTRTINYLPCGSRNIVGQGILAQQTIELCVVSGSIVLNLNEQNKCEGATVGRNIFNTSISIIGTCDAIQ